jgi:diphthamide synthase (EF-2-diphthine--ammonia ligase)
MERHKQPGGPIVVSRAVYEGVEAVRQGGVTNMLQRDTVRQVAQLLGFEEAYEWIRDHPDLYSQAIFRGLAVEDGTDQR